MSSQIPRKQRCDAGIFQVTQRDVLAQTWIAEQYCIPLNQLRMLLAQYTTASIKKQAILSPSTTHDAVERWLQFGFIDQPHKIFHEHSPSIWLSRKGVRELALPYAYYQPKPSTLRHISAVNTLRLHLQRCGISLTRCSLRMFHQATGLHSLPDAEFHIDRASPIAVQVIERPLTESSLRDQCTCPCSPRPRIHLPVVRAPPPGG